MNRKNAQLRAEQIDHKLVGAHHDGGVGDLSDKVRGQATVQCPVSLLSGNCEQSLEEGAVLAALFP